MGHGRVRQSLQRRYRRSQVEPVLSETRAVRARQPVATLEQIDLRQSRRRAGAAAGIVGGVPPLRVDRVGQCGRKSAVVPFRQDLGYLDQRTFADLESRFGEIARMLNGLAQKLASSSFLTPHT